MRRILLIIAFVLVSVAMAFGIYALFFRGAPPVVVNNGNVPGGNVNGGGLTPSTNGTGGINGNTNTGGQTGLPPGVSPVADGGVTAVTPVAPVPTEGAMVSTGGTVNYYNKSDGKFYRIGPDGTVSTLSNREFFNVQDATFSPDGNKAILEFPDGANVIYDFSAGQQVTLPSHWEDFGFSPTGSQVVAKSMAVDPSARFLVVANSDGTGVRPIQEIGANADKVQVNWSPTNEVVATATTGQTYGTDRQEVYFVGQYGENFKSMIVEGLDFRPTWVPGGDRMLYSVAGSGADWRPQLWIVDAQGDNIGRNRRSIAVNTWADKCTFQDRTTVFCAVPTELPRGAGLQPAIADSVPDNIYRINLDTGVQTQIAIPEGSHTVGSIMLTPDGQNLYFTDKATGVLNRIRLQ